MQDVIDCDVCEKQDIPLILVEVSQGVGDQYRWIGACSEECLQRIVIRWKVIGEIIRPGQEGA